MGCCLATLIFGLISRIAILLWWLVDRPLFTDAFKNLILPGNVSFPAWLWTLAGAIFLPWTTLAYIFLFPGGIVGYEWIVLGVALVIDLAGHGGTYRHRSRVPGLFRR
jgi:hypothetical protein